MSEDPASSSVKKTARQRRGKAPGTIRGRVRPHDPFELIRWLAFSQPDPRKALAELVQNSLDANASRIRVVRVRERGQACLRIMDDGDGVIPELDRKEALRYIATHIGHSRKRHLSPQERLELMTQGRYGIGLLGFWSLGEMLEMRTATPGDRPHRLILYRDRPAYRIEPVPGSLPLGDRWTEIVVAGVHREALPVLAGRRAADYLASELRGQLLAREVDLVVEDRMARGRAQKIVPVRPPRFFGDQLTGLGPVDVDGYPPVRLEIYLRGDLSEGEEPQPIGVYSGGTLVAEGFHDLGSLGLARPPWTDPHFTGFVDFPGFQVAPGSRRGIAADAAASAFTRAIAPVERILNQALEAFAARRAEELDRTLIRDLQRAFRDFYRQRPRYSMLPVRTETDDASGAGTADAGPGGKENGGDIPEGRAVAEPPSPVYTPPAAIGHLLPPGPLASVRITPDPIRIECNASREARAVALDETGRPIDDDVRWEWELDARLGELRSDDTRPDRTIILAGPQPAEGELSVTARSGDIEVSASVAVAVVDRMPTRRGAEGIPDPELVDQPGALWRSRMLDGAWQVNTGHRDYQSVADKPTLKLRYLALLFAKEIVVRSAHDPRLADPLEQLVEVAAYADRNLTSRGRRASPRKPSSSS